MLPRGLPAASQPEAALVGMRATHKPYGFVTAVPAKPGDKSAMYIVCADACPAGAAAGSCFRFYLAPKIEDEDMEGEGEAAEN